MFCANCGKEMQIKTKRGYDIYTGETITQIAVCKNCNITREITPKQNNVTITEVLEKFNSNQGNDAESAANISNEIYNTSSDGYCPKCGKKMRTQSKKEGYSARHGYSYRVYNICDDCSVIEDMGAVNETDVKRATHNKIAIKEEKPVYYVKKDNSGWKWLVAIILIIVIFNMLSNSAEENQDYASTKHTETPEPTESKEDYIASCKEYDYKKVLRNPNEYIGKKIKVTLDITNVHEKTKNNPQKYYIALHTNSILSWDVYVINEARYDSEPKLLDTDTATIYGEIVGTEQVTNALKKTTEAIVIDMRYVELKE